MNDYQLQLYREAIADYQRMLQAAQGAEQRGNPILAVLHRVRAICADPRPNGFIFTLSHYWFCGNRMGDTNFYSYGKGVMKMAGVPLDEKSHFTHAVKRKILEYRVKSSVAALTLAALMLGCATDGQQQLQAQIAACRSIPRKPGNYERRAACELEAESQAYLARNPDMTGTWRALIIATRAEYARADRAEQSVAEADLNAAMLREAAETGTGCLTDACGTGSRWHFPADPPY